MNTPSQFSFRQANKLVRKLHLRSGDFLLIREHSTLATFESIDAIIHACERLGIDGMVLVVRDFDDIKVADEAEMNKHGWFHIEHMKRLLLRKKDEQRPDSPADTDTPGGDNDLPVPKDQGRQGQGRPEQPV